MEFRQWLMEWEGSKFSGDDREFYNSPQYPLSKYKGHGDTYGEPSNFKKIEKMFKFKPTYVFKSMKKMKRK